MRTIYLSGIVIATSVLLHGCPSDSNVVECNLGVDKKTGVATVKKYQAGTDCDNLRKLVAEGKELPPAIDEPAKPTTPTKAAPTKAPTFQTSFVSAKKADLTPTTDKKSRVDELNLKISKAGNQRQDPFLTIPGLIPLPNLTAITAPKSVVPKVVVSTPRPLPPRTEEAEAVNVLGTIEMAGTRFAILTAPGDTTSRYVKAGQRIAGGLVLVKRIEMSYGTPFVVLQQSGVEVTRAVGATPQVVSDASSTTPLTSPVSGVPVPGVIMPPALR
ncbi:hypothetical protein V2H45_13520 [Tumidithrix elongata RA019]|uniref:Type IV pilus biogenesis protein PilP n=1 Tax=Tumidithrix elongata BACA0141 TaxID=2716417 RepID=A0AAW9PT86_9CYAN|nr:hypothetical protein [Tumidithrix elongata RA019]